MKKLATTSTATTAPSRKTSAETRAEVDLAQAAHDSALARVTEARAAYEAAPSDPGWEAVEAAESASRRPRADLLSAQKRLAAAEEQESAEAAAKARDAAVARLTSIRATLSKSTGIMNAHCAALVEAERAIATTWAALEHDIAEWASMRAEAESIASSTGVEADLAPPVTLKLVKATIAVHPDRAKSEYVTLHRAPPVARDRERYLVELLAIPGPMPDTARAAELFPVSERVPAMLDGSYPARLRAVGDQIRAEEATQRAAMDARALEARRDTPGTFARTSKSLDELPRA